MKKSLKTISVMLLAAVAFIGCNKKSGNDTTLISDSLGIAKSAAIAYINIDSLVANYDMYKDLSSSFQAKSSKVEAELTSKGRSFERDVMSFQEKVQKGLVTRAQAQTMEAELQQKQQSFMQNRDRIVGELTEEEQVMLNQIHYSIVEYLKEYNKDGRFGMIISSNTSGPILNADPSLDITKEVAVGINKHYAATKSTTKETPKEETK